jgi:hypothetical protein
MLPTDLLAAFTLPGISLVFKETNHTQRRFTAAAFRLDNGLISEVSP